MTPVYPLLYDILQNYLFGALELTPHMEFVLTELATIGCIAAMAVPFVLIWTAIRSFFGVIFP